MQRVFLLKNNFELEKYTGFVCRFLKGDYFFISNQISQIKRKAVICATVHRKIE